MKTMIWYGQLDQYEIFRQYLKQYSVQCFTEQEDLIPALMERCPAAVLVMMENAAGMEGVIAARRMYPNLPIAWFSNDSGFAPQAYRLHVDYFALMPPGEEKIRTALRKCGLTD